MKRHQFLTTSLGGVFAAHRAEVSEKIEQARQAALAVLKPTNAQLEHGLEFHRNSIVFESYGFSPDSAWGAKFTSGAVLCDDQRGVVADTGGFRKDSGTRT